MYWDYFISFMLQAIVIGLFIYYYSVCPPPLRIIGYTLFVNLIVELIAYFFFAVRSENNLFIFHGLTIFQFCMLSLFYKQILTHPKIRSVVSVAIPAFVVFGVVNALYINSLLQYNSYALIVKHFFLSLLILLYFNQLLLSNEEEKILLNPYFWISCGLLVASLGNFFIEGLMNYLMAQSNELATQFYLVGVVLTCLFYIGSIIAILLANYTRYTHVQC